MKTTSKKIGRPNTLGKSSVRTFRLPENEYNLLSRFAAGSKLSASDALRLIIVRQLANPSNPFYN